MDVPVPQILEDIVALVACRRQATARVDVHASQADCAWPGGEWPLPPEGTAGGCPWTSLLQVTSRGAHKTHAINPPSLGCVFVICRFSLSVLSLFKYFGAGTRSIFVRSLARVSPVPPQLTSVESAHDVLQLVHHLRRRIVEKRQRRDRINNLLHGAPQIPLLRPGKGSDPVRPRPAWLFFLAEEFRLGSRIVDVKFISRPTSHYHWCK